MSCLPTRICIRNCVRLNNLAASLPPQRQSAAEGLDLYDQARKSADNALALNPSHLPGIQFGCGPSRIGLRYWTKLGRGSESMQLLEEALSDSKAFVRKNPAVVRAYMSQTERCSRNSWCHYQKLSKLDEALALWEDLVRINEGLAQRFPEAEGYQIDRIEALFGVYDIETAGLALRMPPAPSTVSSRESMIRCACFLDRRRFWEGWCGHIISGAYLRNVRSALARPSVSVRTGSR